MDVMEVKIREMKEERISIQMEIDEYKLIMMMRRDDSKKRRSDHKTARLLGSQYKQKPANY
jgi:hypothetical protein